MKKQQIPKELIPDNDTLRLKKLEQYEILDTAPENDFDTIAGLAAQVFENSNGFISFVDQNEVFYKAHTGKVRTNRVARTADLSAICVSANETIVFPAIHQITELVADPERIAQQDIRFFAAAPIKTEDGYVLGAIGVSSDQAQTNVSTAQVEMLKSLARIVMDKLDTNLVNRRIVRAYDDRLHRLAHDMKNPITSISLYAQLLSSRVMDPEKIKEMSARIGKAAKDAENSLDLLLTNIRTENPANSLIHQQIWVRGLIEELRLSFQSILESKNQALQIAQIPDIAIAADQNRIMDILVNLLSNASKYADAGTTIYIDAAISEDNAIVLEFRDEGQGLSASDADKMFIKYATLSSNPTAREKSYGLGLSIVKMLTESFKGKVWFKSEGKGKGSSFFVSFPVSQIAP